MKNSANLRSIVYALVFGLCVLCATLVIIAFFKYKSSDNASPTQMSEKNSTALQTTASIESEEPTVTAQTSESVEDTVQQPLVDEVLYNCVWDASVQTDTLVEFFSDGTCRIINLVGQLTEKGVESEGTYEFEDGIMKITCDSGRSYEWTYSDAEGCFVCDGIEYDGSVFHQKIERVTLYELYLRWAGQLREEVEYLSEYEWLGQTQLSIGHSDAYKAWGILLNDIYDHLMQMLSEEKAAKLVSEQLQWIDEKERDIEDAYNAYFPGTAAPMFGAMMGALDTEIRVYELLLLLPEGFDHEAHSAKIQLIRDRFYASEELRGQMSIQFFGTSATAYYLDGELRILEESSDVSQSETPTAYSADYFLNCKRIWYYDEGEVYFIFMVNEENGDEYRLYFDNGELIRWVSPAGRTYDLCYRWEEMQGYYEYALSQCRSVESRGKS